jgi:hypothetical protein
MEAHAVLMPSSVSATRTRLIWTCRLLAGLLILAAALARLGYLAYLSPLDLAPDEAHYWDWSRHLDWSYYSKGPLVAWLIRLSCELVGHWAEQHTGSLTFAVRLPAVICGSLLLVSLYVLVLQIFAKEPLALGVVAGGLCFPLVTAGSSLMTIDSPYACCWGWALVLGHRAVWRDSLWAWLATGVLVGLGMLAKYTMVIWLPSLGLFLLTSSVFRDRLFRPGFWIMVVVAGLCCVPILVWNSQHNWVTFRHVLVLAGLLQRSEAASTSSSLNWLGPLIYLAAQCGLLLGFWFVVWLAAMWTHRPTVETDPGLLYLWWLSAPMFLLFLAFSPKTDGGEVNWPVTAYISGLVLAAGWLYRQWLSLPRLWRLSLRVATVCTLLIGLGLCLGLHFSSAAWPLLARLAGPPEPGREHPIRKLDPTCRLRGWRWLAAKVDRIRTDLEREEGAPPVLVCQSWTQPGQLGIYLGDHPQVYCIGSVTGSRHSQYDLWPGPITNPERFRGQTFIIVGGINKVLEKAFTQVRPTQYLHYHEHGQPVATWVVTVCHGFKGFPEKAGKGGY